MINDITNPTIYCWWYAGYDLLLLYFLLWKPFRTSRTMRYTHWTGIYDFDLFKFSSKIIIQILLVIHEDCFKRRGTKSTVFLIKLNTKKVRQITTSMLFVHTYTLIMVTGIQQFSCKILFIWHMLRFNLSEIKNNDGPILSNVALNTIFLPNLILCCSFYVCKNTFPWYEFTFQLRLFIYKI